MTLDTPITNARTLLLTDINGLTNPDAISLANEAQYAIIADLIKKGINAAQIQESFENATDMVGTYLWPADLWLVKELMVNYIDSTQKNYVEVSILDPGNLPAGMNIEVIRANQSTTNPCIVNYGDWFEILPAPNNSVDGQNLTSFFELFYYLAPTLFVSAAGDGTDVTVPYPLSLDPYLLSSRMAQIHALRGDEEMMTRAKGYGELYAQKLDTIEIIIQKPTQKSTVATGINLTGNEF